MRWVSELSNYNFSINYQPGKVSVDCDYLSRTPVKSFENHTEETDFSSVSVVISALSTSSGNWMTVLPSTTNILDKLNFENDDILDSINLEEMKNEQKHDSVIKPIYNAVVSDRKLLHSERTKFGGGGVKLNYWNKLKLNQNEILVKRNLNNEQLLLPKKYHRWIFRELHESMGHLRFHKVVELIKQRFY